MKSISAVTINTPNTTYYSMRIAVIADDLTGALDTGVQFKQWGYEAKLVENPDNPKAQAVIINTDTRNKTRDEAYQIVYNIAEQLREYDIIYKKIDSTLRGNPGAEMEAILDATGEKQAILTPAYPPTMRSVKQGHLYIGEDALTETEYIQEHREKTSYIPEILDIDTETHIQTNPDNIMKNGIIIIDSDTEKDLQKIAANHTRILAGSAGLADALCHTLRDPPPVMTVIGSTRSETRNQAEQLHRRLDVAIIPLNTLKTLGQTPQYETIQRARRALKQRRDLIITSAPSRRVVEQTWGEAKRLDLSQKEIETRITMTLAQITEELLKNELSGIIITGGATAQAITRQLKTKEITILDEVQPGVPVIRLDETPAVTKAGGFGQPDTLIQATKYLKRKHK
ncbi:hypothetical protein GF326_02755 [Candidatus Bathyarchaeota archaeon]|nr:hypothetical protein [Candidatus Bathyarchaeota archaeon]